MDEGRARKYIPNVLISMMESNNYQSIQNSKACGLSGVMSVSARTALLPYGKLN